MSKVWIVTESPGAVAGIAHLLNFNLSELAVLVLGQRELAEEAARGVGECKWIDTGDRPSDCYAQAAAEVLASTAPTAIIGIATPGVRAAFGSAALSLGAALASNVVAASVQGDTIDAERLTIDDNVIETLEMLAPACLLVSSFSVQPVDADPAAGTTAIEQVPVSANTAFDLVSSEPTSESKLKDAEYVVSVGSGIANAEALAKAQHLATLMGAELGCSMPVANELNLMPPTSYIGWSGVRIAPKLCLSFGISGARQHIIGVRNTRAIVAVNKDPKALFFQNADYGIVADLNEAIPEFIRALS